MKNAFWAYWLVLLGILVVVIMLLVRNLTTTSTQDYYLLKEITDASLVDAVDYNYYRNYGEIRINKEKFYESFLRRFAETANLSTTYTISFYGVYEAPPKVSVEIKSKSNVFNIARSSTSFDMVERIDTILEGKPLPNVTTSPGTNNQSGNNNPTPTPTPTPTPSDSTSSNPTPTTTETKCTDGVTSTKLTGKHGTSMKANLPIYDSYNGTKTIGTATPGEIFVIGGETGNRWQIEYNGECGWVDYNSTAINLMEYLGKNVGYNITNASGAIFKFGYKDDTGKINYLSINDLTGRRLYSGEFSSFVPATYTFAKKLKAATDDSTYNFVIYDAYRPVSASSTMYTTAEADYYKLSGDMLSKIFGNRYLGDYLYPVSGGKYSKHNYGCAVDITIAGATMPTEMHVLGQIAAPTSSGAAAILKSEMSGLSGISSEWWHFEDSSCTVTAPLNFWGA